MKRAIAISIFLSAFAAANAAAAPLWMRYARISPDGQHIAFAYKGDIYTVPVKGGDAVRITSQPTFESHPVWSPDSKTLAFTSDRYGNNDIFIVDASKPGELKRLTFNSAYETP